MVLRRHLPAHPWGIVIKADQPQAVENADLAFVDQRVIGNINTIRHGACAQAGQVAVFFYCEGLPLAVFVSHPYAQRDNGPVMQKAADDIDVFEQFFLSFHSVYR